MERTPELTIQLEDIRKELETFDRTLPAGFSPQKIPPDYKKSTEELDAKNIIFVILVNNPKQTTWADFALHLIKVTDMAKALDRIIAVAAAFFILALISYVVVRGEP